MAIRNVLLATAALFVSTAAFAADHTTAEVKAPASIEVKKDETAKKEIKTETKTEVKKEEAVKPADKKEIKTETKTEVKKEEVKK